MSWVGLVGQNIPHTRSEIQKLTLPNDYAPMALRQLHLGHTISKGEHRRVLKCLFWDSSISIALVFRCCFHRKVGGFDKVQAVRALSSWDISGRETRSNHNFSPTL